MKTKTDINRRRFLKTTAMTFAATGLSTGVFSTPFKFLYTDDLDPSDEFSLLKLSKILPDYKFPFVEDFLNSNYILNYSLYNLYPLNHHHIKAGSFMMNKANSNTNLSDYSLKIKRLANTDMTSNAGEFYYFLKAKLSAENDLYSTPVKWECETKIGLSEYAPAYMNTLHSWTGDRTKRKIVLRSSHYDLSKTYVSKNLTWKWGIIDLVQGMARESIHQTNFSTLDEFDMIYDNQSVRFRKNKSIDCGSKTIPFKVFDLTGDGIVPTVYWVDDHNRVCFIISGMEAYMVEK